MSKKKTMEEQVAEVDQLVTLGREFLVDIITLAVLRSTPGDVTRQATIERVEKRLAEQQLQLIQAIAAIKT